MPIGKRENSHELVIVAEDSPPNLKIIVHLLEKLEYEVIACTDGMVAWEEIEKNKDNNISLVISDIMMPNMDGIELLKNIRQTDKLKDTPVILITALSDKEYVVEAKKLDVNGYVLKPVTFRRLREKLGQLFPNKKFPQLAS